MNFENFMRTLTSTNIALELLVDFNKVESNISSIEIKLNQLNYLLNKTDLRKAINQLYKEAKDCFSILHILCAVRDNKLTINPDTKQISPIFEYFNKPDSIYDYFQKTGLERLFTSGSITNLVDYVFGIEVGLDTNARKNRGGKSMEKMISSIFDKAGITYQTQVSDKDLINFSYQSQDRKTFDFVVKARSKTFLIETNFYNGGGSKLNEVARSYTDLAKNINKLDSYEFVWITDGLGWNYAKNKLEEAFINIPRIYNLTTIEQFVKEIES